MHITSKVLSHGASAPKQSTEPCTSALIKHEGRQLFHVCFYSAHLLSLTRVSADQHDLSLLADIAFCMLNIVSMTAAASFE